MDVDSMKNEATWKEFWETNKQNTAAGHFDVEMVSIDDDGLTLRMEITNRSRQPFGLFHGGVSMLLAESAGSMHACWGLDLSERYPVGIEINGSHVGSARDGHVVATARVIRRGRTLIVHEVEITHEETGKLLNVSRITNLYVPNRN